LFHEEYCTGSVCSKGVLISKHAMLCACMFIALDYLTSDCRYLALVLNTYLPPSPIPACVHTAITVPEVVMCHFPDATPCCNVCLHFEVAFI